MPIKMQARVRRRRSFGRTHGLSIAVGGVIVAKIQTQLDHHRLAGVLLRLAGLALGGQAANLLDIRLVAVEIA